MAGVAVFMLNAIVAVLKIGLGRGEPGTGNPDFFVGGMAYPSGHTSNIVLVYGLMPYLLGTYAEVSPRTVQMLWRRRGAAVDLDGHRVGDPDLALVRRPVGRVC